MEHDADIIDLDAARADRAKGSEPAPEVALEGINPAISSGMPEPVNGTQLLDEIAWAFRRHLSLPDRAADAIALWVLFAHTFDAWQASPRLLFSSPVPQCGKSTALTMLGKLTP